MCSADEIMAHAPSIVGVVSMVLAADVLVGVLNGTGMVPAGIRSASAGEWASRGV